ncbi:MAG: hypothetical protein ACLQVI_15860 [Polyangiaceae bacterium]|jgi:hypothetical protein
MVRSRVLSLVSCTFAIGAFACTSTVLPPVDTTGGTEGTAAANSAPTGSEVAVSVVSGALNNNSGTGVAWYPPAPKSSRMQRAFAFLNPIGTAYAATWVCTGDTLTPTFDGPGADPYSFTPASCSITWANGATGSSVWSGPFTLNFGPSCDAVHPLMEKQAAGCELTRTTATNGDTRTITGWDGSSYAIEHNTNGEGTGWDSSVTPAPNNDGVEITCGAGGCSSTRSIVINGSHLTGTVTVGAASTKIWDHTVTAAAGMSVVGAGAERLVSGVVTVQHNLLKYTSTTTFSSVGYGEPLCCFPTAGSVSTTFSSGTNVGKTETLAFSAACGEATLTAADGSVASLTLQNCL